MFGNKKNEMSQGINGTSIGANSNNSIVTGTKIEGKITANSDIRIDGELVGDLDCKGRLVVGPEGSVKGNVTCQNAVIEGRFDGNLKVQELLNVRETANITGDIFTDKLIVQSGAIYNVNCQMGKVTKGSSSPNKQGIEQI